MATAHMGSEGPSVLSKIGTGLYVAAKAATVAQAAYKLGQTLAPYVRLALL